ncbi:Dynamin [Dactylella cylindrospora]|nr:Dynamin [Dactylella cylindrospora]
MPSFRRSNSIPDIEVEKTNSSFQNMSIKSATGKRIALDDSIGTQEHRELLDRIDKLRELGVNRILALPQLVVAGDQSSGKSSVLEALTGLPLPRSSGLCTRFATEISLRRSPQSKPVSISIKPGPSKDRLKPNDQSKIDSFRKRIPEEELTADKFLEILIEASDIMGVPRPGQRTDRIPSARHAFSDYLLSIELCGPHHGQFSVIDLPGLIR